MDDTDTWEARDALVEALSGSALHFASCDFYGGPGITLEVNGVKFVALVEYDEHGEKST